MTCYVQIVHNQRKFDPDDWHPWKNCKSPIEAAQLATNKFIREAGYAVPDATFEPFELMVYVATDKSPRHKNGRFVTCEGFKMKVLPKNE